MLSQHGCDSHRLDPLADLMLTVDGQQAAHSALHDLAHEICGGRWIAVGGGGYEVVQVVPRSWTQLLAVATGGALDPSTEVPPGWREFVATRSKQPPPVLLGDGTAPSYSHWEPGEGDVDSPLDLAVAATRRAVWPLHGLRPGGPVVTAEADGARARATAPAPYPPHWEADIVLADGGTVHLRPITPADADRLVKFHATLSEQSIYYRFFAFYPVLSDRDILRFTTVDHHNRCGLVAVLGDQLIAVVHYDRIPDTADAEVAFAVADPAALVGIGDREGNLRVGGVRDAVVVDHGDELVAEDGDQPAAVVVVHGGEPEDVAVGQHRVEGEEPVVDGLLRQRGVELDQPVGVGRSDRAQVHRAAVCEHDVGLPVRGIGRGRRGASTGPVRLGGHHRPTGSSPWSGHTARRVAATARSSGLSTSPSPGSQWEYDGAVPSPSNTGGGCFDLVATNSRHPGGTSVEGSRGPPVATASSWVHDRGTT